MVLEIKLVEHDRHPCLAKQLPKAAHRPCMVGTFMPVTDEDLIAHRLAYSALQFSLEKMLMRMAEKITKVKNWIRSGCPYTAR